MIVATAGHIDHGKTTLVKALTGVDTDRLPEEKARGISIDLGFAYWKVAGADGKASTIGFVDVPGHERFVRNMLAGVCGVDFVMLVVAADDGPMPQTREHLNIVDLLRISLGVAVITKCDRVTPQRIEQVAATVRDLMSTTALAGSPVLPVSAVTGSGLDSLRQTLAGAAAAHRNHTEAGRRLRFAIDRVFTVAGSGTVVTGTVFAGAVVVGQRLVVTPSGVSVRVRGLQQDGKPVPSARAGERCSMNLAGVDLSQLARGDWVVDSVLHAPTQRMDVRIQVLPTESQALRHWTPVHLHLGPIDVGARVALRRAGTVLPGDSSLAQLIIDKPIGALSGDRFILRDQSAMRTIGGGTVIDAFTPQARRRVQRAQQLNAMERPDPLEVLGALADCAGGVNLAHFERSFNLTGERIESLVAQQRLFTIGKEPPTGLPHTVVDSIKEAATDVLAKFHVAQPQALGINLNQLGRKAAPQISAPTFQSLLRVLAPECGIEIAGEIARLARHVATDNPADQRMWQQVMPVLDSAGLHGLTLVELANDAGVKEMILKDFFLRKARTGEVVRVTTNRFYLRRTLAQGEVLAQGVSQASPDGKFTAAQFRDCTQLGRTRAIEILECLDRLGITQRIGDSRIMRHDFSPILGEAAMPLPSAERAS